MDTAVCILNIYLISYHSWDIGLQLMQTPGYPILKAFQLFQSDNLAIQETYPYDYSTKKRLMLIIPKMRQNNIVFFLKI